MLHGPALPPGFRHSDGSSEEAAAVGGRGGREQEVGSLDPRQTGIGASAAPGPSLPAGVSSDPLARAVPSRLAASFSVPGGAALAAAYSTTGRHVAVGGTDGVVRIYSPLSSLLVRELFGLSSGDSAGVRAVAVRPDGAEVAVGGGDGTALLLDVEAGRVSRRFPAAHRGGVASVSYAATAGRGGGGGAGGGGARGPRRGSGSGPGAAPAGSPSPPVLLTSGADGTVKLWDLRSRSRDPIQTLGPFGDGATDAQLVDPLGRLGGPSILATSLDGALRSFDVRAGREVVDWPRGPSGPPLTSLDVSGDSRLVALASGDSTVLVLSRLEGALLAELVAPGEHAHESLHQRCAISRDGTVVVGASETGRVTFWSVESGRVLASAQATERGPCCALALAPDDGQLVAGGLDGEVRVFLKDG